MHRSLRLDEVAAPLVRSRLCARVAEPLALRLHGAPAVRWHAAEETFVCKYALSVRQRGG